MVDGSFDGCARQPWSRCHVGRGSGLPRSRLEAAQSFELFYWALFVAVGLVWLAIGRASLLLRRSVEWARGGSPC
eukprot:14549270-Alexandrium_andersonii.AAC.1